MKRDNPDFRCPGRPILAVAHRGPKWHTSPLRRLLAPALRKQAIRHFRSVPEWHQNHDPKVATLCQIEVFFHDDVTSLSRAAGQPLFAPALARIRSTPARERGVEKCMTGFSPVSAASQSEFAVEPVADDDRQPPLRLLGARPCSTSDRWRMVVPVLTARAVAPDRPVNPVTAFRKSGEKMAIAGFCRKVFKKAESGQCVRPRVVRKRPA